MIRDLETQKKAVQTVRKCQRNWDLNHTIPKEHIDHWTYLATNSPSKQDEARYGVCVVTNKALREKIYDDYVWGSHRFGNDAGRNTQAGANALFIFGEAEPTDEEFDTDGISQDRSHVSKGFEYRMEINRNRDIGLAMGIVSFSAAQLGYRTGFNTNLYYNKHTQKDWRRMLDIPEETKFKPLVILGIGYPDPSLEWFQTRDIEYLEADPREGDLKDITTLEKYKGIRKKWDDKGIHEMKGIREFGPLSHSIDDEPYPKKVFLAVRD